MGRQHNCRLRGRCFQIKDAIQYTAQLLSGETISGTASGFLARGIQHEIDHLNGTLFIDHLSGLKRTRALQKFRKSLEEKEH